MDLAYDEIYQSSKYNIDSHYSEKEDRKGEIFMENGNTQLLDRDTSTPPFDWRNGRGRQTARSLADDITERITQAVNAEYEKGKGFLYRRKDDPTGAVYIRFCRSRCLYKKEMECTTPEIALAISEYRESLQPGRYCGSKTAWLLEDLQPWERTLYKRALRRDAANGRLK